MGAHGRGRRAGSQRGRESGGCGPGETREARKRLRAWKRSEGGACGDGAGLQERGGAFGVEVGPTGAKRGLGAGLVGWRRGRVPFPRGQVLPSRLPSAELSCS